MAVLHRSRLGPGSVDGGDVRPEKTNPRLQEFKFGPLEGWDRARAIPFQEGPVKLLDCLSPVRLHSPDIGEIGAMVKNHGKGMGIAASESVAKSRDQPPHGFLIVI
jgi:hypothetical protein